MYKKITALIIALALSGAALSACGNTENNNNSSQSSQTVQTPAVPDTADDPSSVYDTADTADTAVSQAEDTDSAVQSEDEDNTDTSSDTDLPKQVEAISLNYKAIALSIGESLSPEVTFTPSENIDNDKIKWKSSNDFIASVDKYGCITANEEGSCIITAVSASNEDANAQIEVTVTKPGESISDGSLQELYVNGILIVNKKYSIPRDYNPGGLTAECASAFEEMRQAAAEDDINIYILSGYRSYETQKELYERYVSMYGKEEADRFSAQPGHSEHQTGLAIDCVNAGDSFIGTDEAQWLEEHCYEYGFIIRYPQGKEHITGYKYEPWHIRYVGDIAESIYYSGLTLEEYFSISN